MNIFNVFKDFIEIELEKLGAHSDGASFSVEPPRDSAHGEISTNAALVQAKALGQKPQDLSQSLSEALLALPNVLEASVAGPGFVNLRLRPAYWQACVTDILRKGIRYGESDQGGSRRVNIEYVSANPTGPMHVGHGRGAVVGDALAALLSKIGFDVTREYYVNDAGAQIDKLACSLHHRYREALGEDAGSLGEGLYPGEYLIGTAAALLKRDGDRWRGTDVAEWLPEFRAFAVNAMMDLICDDLSAMGIVHDVFTSELALAESGAVEGALKDLQARELIHVGVLEPPKGKMPEDWKPRPQTLFRSTEFGDDVDRAISKSDGSWTYFASDIAYHKDKIDRGFPILVDVWGADHKGYVKRMQAAVEALGEGSARLDVMICNLVNLSEGGEPVKMSKRAGTFVTLREVVDRVGKDVLRFIMLTRSNEAALDFDLAQAVEQSKDNPVFYVQYAHARACSVMRNAQEAFLDMDFSDAALAEAKLDCLIEEDEMDLVRKLASWPRVVETAAEAFEPHRVAYYLSEIAAGFHGLWNKGNLNDRRRFLIADDRAVTEARLALVRATAIVIESGLQIMGVTPVEEMR